MFIYIYISYECLDGCFNEGTHRDASAQKDGKKNLGGKKTSVKIGGEKTPQWNPNGGVWGSKSKYPALSTT